MIHTMSDIPSIDSLHKEKLVKDNSKIEIFTTVLNKCVEKIIYTNRHTDQTFVIFDVPQILIGYPSYDLKMCILFLINKLSQKGYYVSFIAPSYLYIDWGSSTNSEKPQGRIVQQTQSLLRKFPNISKIEFVYEDTKRNRKHKSKKS